TAGSPPAVGAPASASRSVRASSRRTAGVSGPRTCRRGASRSSSRCRWPTRHPPRCPPMPDPVVVLIEDEPQIRRFLRATLRGQERDKVTALDAGADDYVSKPFGASELLARIRVALRHTAGASHEADDATFTIGELRMDLLHRQVFVGDREVRLTPIEYKLLATLVRHAGKVVTHQQLLREVWGPTHTDQAHYVRVYMAHLRHKLEAEPARPQYLRTEPGVG